jgi:hypothetical protein
MDAEAQKAITSDKPVRWNGATPMQTKQAITRIRQQQFLKAFAQCGNITAACKAIKINASTQRNWHNDPSYASQFKDAYQEYCDLIRGEIHNRAIVGEQVPIIGKKMTPFGPEDTILGYKTVKSDILLMFHAKPHMPEYRDNYKEQVQETRPQSESPISRIMIRLDMIDSRQQVSLPAGNGIRVIDIQADQRQLTEGDLVDGDELLPGNAPDESAVPDAETPGS